MKVLAVGDIHQKAWILDKVEKLIDNYDKVVFIGDYADDFGAKPQDRINIWREVRSFQSRHSPKVVLLTGNHDYVYVNSLYYGMYTGWSASAQVLLNLDSTLKRFVKDLPISVKIDGITYSHAGFTKYWYESQSPMEDNGPLWVRPHYGHTYLSNQVFGHTPSKTCYEVQDRVWCIDTFSTHSSGEPYGDNTLLEIINGQMFNVIKIGGKEHGRKKV